METTKIEIDVDYYRVFICETLYMLVEDTNEVQNKSFSIEINQNTD